MPAIMRVNEHTYGRRDRRHMCFPVARTLPAGLAEIVSSGRDVVIDALVVSWAESIPWSSLHMSSRRLSVPVVPEP